LKITFLLFKKTTPTPAPVAPAPVAAAPVSVTPAPTVQIQPPAAPVAAAASQFETAEGVAALTGMGFPETESRAALNAAYGNADLAYEYLLTGIPERARVPNTANRQAMQAAVTTPVAATAGGIEQLRNHPQFNMLKQLVQQNPAQLPQVLDLIGQQDPALLAAIHANNDIFIAMMNEPVVDTPPVAAVPAFGAAGPLADPTQMIQMLGTMAPAQRAQFAQTLGMTPAQLEGFMQMMSNMPPDQLQQMMAGAGAGVDGPGGGADTGNVIRLTAEEMDSVNRLMALGFSQQEAAQAYIACDKNEGLAANLLLEGGWMDDEDGYGGGGGHDDDMYH
jgi:UV excision repair protein RAD23